jgi:hypothetical protein
MVPGHPPCALISLIFSSLDPETNCFVKSLYVFIFCSLAFARSLPIPNYSVLQLAFFLNRFFCCAVVKVHPFTRFCFAFAQLLARLRSVSIPLLEPSPENDTD